MTINDFSLGDKFQYLGREAMCIPFEHYGCRLPINAIDIKTGSILYVPEEKELEPIEIHSIYTAEKITKKFGQLFIGDKFFYRNYLFIKSNAFLDTNDILVTAYCLTNGKMGSIWDYEEVFPAYEIRKEYSK